MSLKSKMCPNGEPCEHAEFCKHTCAKADNIDLLEVASKTIQELQGELAAEQKASKEFARLFALYHGNAQASAQREAVLREALDKIECHTDTKLLRGKLMDINEVHTTAAKALSDTPITDTPKTAGQFLTEALGNEELMLEVGRKASERQNRILDSNTDADEKAHRRLCPIHPDCGCSDSEMPCQARANRIANTKE